MAKVTIVYWQQIPSMVEARDRAGRHKIQLSHRFQELIDQVAMRKRLAGTDAYLLQWAKGDPAEHEGSAEEAARSVAAEIEGRFDAIRTQELANCKAGPS